MRRVHCLAAVLALLALPGPMWAQGCMGSQLCAASVGYVEVGSSGLQRIERMTVSYTSGVVTTFRDANGVVHKKLAPDGVAEDIVLTFDQVNAALIGLIDAFLDVRPVTVELIATDQMTSKSPRLGIRATGAVVRAITFTAPAWKSRCSFRVTLRPQTVQRSTTHQATTLPPSANPNCGGDGVLLTLNSVALPTDRLDSLEFRLAPGSFGTEEPDFPNVRIHSKCVTSTGCKGALEQWHTNQFLGPDVWNETQRSLSVVFALPTKPAALQLDATGVGMVARRLRVDRDSVGTTEFDLYVEKWNRLGRVPNPSAGPGTPPSGGGAPPPAPSAPAASVDPDPPGGTGTFRMNLPTKVVRGTGSLCSIPGNESTFIIQLNGADGVGIFAATGLRPRVGTFPVAADGDGVVRMAFTQSGTVVAYAAKSGTFTFAKIGDRVSGTFRVVADVTDASNEPKEASIGGAFTDLPTTC